MRFKERKCGAHGEHGVKAYMETGMRSVRMMAAMHVQEYVPKRNEKKKKNKASCAYNHVQPKLNLWPLMPTTNNEISCIYYQVMKQDVKRPETYQVQGSFISLVSSSSYLPRLPEIRPPRLAVLPSSFSAISHLPIPPQLSPTLCFLSRPFSYFLCPI